MTGDRTNVYQLLYDSKSYLSIWRRLVKTYQQLINIYWLLYFHYHFDSSIPLLVFYRSLSRSPFRVSLICFVETCIPVSLFDFSAIDKYIFVHLTPCFLDHLFHPRCPLERLRRSLLLRSLGSATLASTARRRLRSLMANWRMMRIAFLVFCALYIFCFCLPMHRLVPGF